jgi:hypothetical protein
MYKINLFYILAFEEQTYKYENKLQEITELENNGIKQHVTTLEAHFYMLSKYFNVHNFFKYKDKIHDFENAVIYHIPFGKDDRDTGIEEILTNFKGNVPIVMRSYDPHSPLKTSKEYMVKYHDLTVSYLNQRVDNENIIFGHICYDNYLINKVDTYKNRNKLACMVLRNRKGSEYSVEQNKFLDMGLSLKKVYGEREKIVKNKMLDVYGEGWPADMENYYGNLFPFDQKYNILKKYKFNLVLDNAIVDSYISEKILDSFLTLTVPVYLGSPTISNYIPECCFIDISNFKNYDELFDYLNNVPQMEYMDYIKNIKKHRDSIFDNFSTKENLAKQVYSWYNEKYDTNLGLNENQYDEIEDNIKKLKFLSSNNLKADICRNLSLNKERFRMYLLNVFC